MSCLDYLCCFRSRRHLTQSCSKISYNSNTNPSVSELEMTKTTFQQNHINTSHENNKQNITHHPDTKYELKTAHDGNIQIVKSDEAYKNTNVSDSKIINKNNKKQLGGVKKDPIDKSIFDKQICELQKLENKLRSISQKTDTNICSNNIHFINEWELI